jgi:hypothetical protein
MEHRAAVDRLPATIRSVRAPWPEAIRRLEEALTAQDLSKAKVRFKPADL